MIKNVTMELLLDFDMLSDQIKQLENLLESRKDLINTLLVQAEQLKSILENHKDILNNLRGVVELLKAIQKKGQA